MYQYFIISLINYLFLCIGIAFTLFPSHSEKNTFGVKMFGIDTWEVFNMSISRRKILLFIDF